ILELIVLSWIEAGEKFVLEEDGDLGYGLSLSNIVRIWKERNSPISYFNYTNSPDFFLIENV
ncbi:hypothetical protein BKA65DRAFT_405209, partial [Rhexocercosporidium sp. MPI-PUGE-AT-0058]